MAETAAATPVLTTEIKLCADDVAVVVCHGRLVAARRMVSTLPFMN